MSETLESVAIDVDHKQLAEQLLAQAREQGVELVGPNGLLNQLTKSVLETALDAEMTEHLGYDKHDAAGRGSGNSRNGTRAGDGVHRDRPGGARRAAGHQQHLRSGDRQEAATQADRHR